MRLSRLEDAWPPRKLQRLPALENLPVDRACLPKKHNASRRREAFSEVFAFAA